MSMLTSGFPSGLFSEVFRFGFQGSIGRRRLGAVGAVLRQTLLEMPDAFFESGVLIFQTLIFKAEDADLLRLRSKHSLKIIQSVAKLSHGHLTYAPFSKNRVVERRNLQLFST
jgi:hypothetical protein